MSGETLALRKLTSDDWLLFKKIRLEALAECPSFFGSNLQAESGYSESEWREMITGNKTHIFGLFAGAELIAVQGISPWRKTPGQAIIWGSYIVPAYRGKGLFARLYTACLECANDEPTWESVTVSHRASNAASGAVIRKSGFAYTHTESRTWPDGVTEDEPCYIYRLPRTRGQATLSLD